MNVVKVVSRVIDNTFHGGGSQVDLHLISNQRAKSLGCNLHIGHDFPFSNQPKRVSTVVRVRV